MPFPERDSQDRPDPHEPATLVPFLIAARFRTELLSKRAYFEAQDLIKSHQDNDLSIYRFQLRTIFHVAVLGESPPQPLEQRLRHILATGDPAMLPKEVISILVARRAEISQQGPWAEFHYR